MKNAYEKLMLLEEQGEKISGITDDAMVVEYTTGAPIKFIEGDYKNIKITTPEDIQIAELFLKWKKWNLFQIIVDIYRLRW